jgi:S-adenosylmethionine decarboxylase
MNDANLFQLGIGLETDGAHAEDLRGREAVHDTRDRICATLCDSEREDHFIRRNGKVYAGTHLIIEVVDGTGWTTRRASSRRFATASRSAARRSCTSTPTSSAPRA